jgi:D-amino-acid dehydrogenase
MRSVIVLGAGMVGVSTAIALKDRGWDVVLVDRKAPGQETSFGNSGIIQREAVEPYPLPRGIGDLFNIAVGRSNDVVYSFSELPFHVGPLLRYWWYSQTGRHRALSQAWASLIGQSTATHGPLIERSGAGDLVRRNGFRILFRTAAGRDKGLSEAERKSKTYGVSFRALSAAEMAAAEPALRDAGVGGLHWLEPWTVSSPGGLVAAYADLFERLGGRFVHGDADTMARKGSGWSVQTESGAVEAEAVVFCLGPWSSPALRQFGYRFSMVLKRGYHIHHRSPQSLQAPVMDVENGYLLIPMVAGTRITTGAHLARQGVPPNYRQLERAERLAKDLYDLGPRVETTPWQGTRPCTPDMLPVIGPGRREKGLWMNFGHGHQGFTLGPASAEVLARMMDGEAPGIDVTPFRPERY